MKIGWVSVSPFAKTGYGRMTREIVSRLMEKHEVMCIGHESDVTVWGSKKELHLPNGKVIQSLVMINPLISPSTAIEIINQYSSKYGFELLIAHWDAFALEFLKNASRPYMVYIPVDAPMTKKWARHIEGTRRLVTYSKFGYREALRHYVPSLTSYIPHGVDVDLFRPIDRDKGDLKEKVSHFASHPIPRDSFLLTCVAANVGERKNLPLLIRTFARFHRKHPEAHLYIHTNAASAQGYDLPSIADELNIRPEIHFPRYNPIMEPATDEEFVDLYNASDVFVSNSDGEGFMLPLLEAQACGLPAIVPNNSAQTELVQGHGWVYDCISPEAYLDYPQYVPTIQAYPVPDQGKLLEAMESAYQEERGSQTARSGTAKAARKFAEGYSWDKVMPLWFDLLEEMADENRLAADFQNVLKG